MTKVFLALVIALLIYEFVALVDRLDGDTISEIIWRATTKHPLIPFLGGLLAGHFWWQR